MPHGVRIMVAYVFLPQEAASPRLEAARTDGIGDAREHGADAAELAFHVNKILIRLLLRTAALRTW